MDAGDYDLLRAFTNAIREQPLPPSDPRYVPVFRSDDDDAEDDPIRRIAQRMLFSDNGESVQLVFDVEPCDSRRFRPLRRRGRL